VTRLLVLAWGNESRGDDALGPAFIARGQAAGDPPGVTTTFVTDFQLQPEHAVDLDGQALALFVDASVDASPPFSFREVVPARTATFSTHGVAPGVVLDAYRLTFGRAPPPAFALAIHGTCFDLGAPLGEPARRHLDAAIDFFAQLRRHPAAEAWRRLAGASAAAAAQESPKPHGARDPA
jgi:hydrogenase maturation protease